MIFARMGSSNQPRAAIALEALYGPFSRGVDQGAAIPLNEAFGGPNNVGQPPGRIA
jgi:hypothetical protein